MTLGMRKHGELSRREWMKSAAGAACFIPLAVSSGLSDATQTPKQTRIDAHTHLEWAGWRAPKPVRPVRTRKSRPGWVEMTQRPERAAEYGQMVRTVKSYEEYAKLYVQEMDAAGIATSCINAMDRELEGYYQVPYWDILKQLAKVRDAYPDRFILFCGIDPHRGARGVELLERAVKELGYRGMGEMLPHYHNFSPDDQKVVYPLYRKCMELNIPVSTNTSAIPGAARGYVCNPERLEEVNYDFPDLNICLSSAGSPYWTEAALGLATLKGGIYLDTADWQVTDALGIKRYLEFLRRALDSAARYKIMYGSDNPVYRRMYNLKEWIDILINDAPKHGFKFTDEELHLYFTQNFNDYLKGVPG